MKYTSTRDSSKSVTAAEAIMNGLASDGGLFLPESLPEISAKELSSLCEMDYPARAAFIMGKFLEGFTAEEIGSYCQKAYSAEKFEGGAAPVKKLSDGLNVLELWHGPTSAFKDMALQILPYLLSASLKKNGEDRTACILVATSGDTGKAALEGFKDVPGTKIIVFFPEDGVSAIQKLQMTTQEGENVAVFAVKGNFDDAQTGVKRVFSDTEFEKQLDENGLFFSSANSINWGRLLPQICYYFSAYCDMVKNGSIELYDKINVCVPTGNFGNILACYFAKKIGLPVNKMICASNSNNVLTDFINTGVYDRNRDFYQTVSPSMDILISSNVERLIYDLSGNDDAYVRERMEALNKSGKYELAKKEADLLKNEFAGFFTSEEETSKTIAEVFETENYLIDTHTAVGYHAYKRYFEQSGDKTKTLLVSTASPYKFAASVLEALTGNKQESTPETLEELSKLTKTAVPAPLKGLDKKTERFGEVIDPANMKKQLAGLLGLE